MLLKKHKFAGSLVIPIFENVATAEYENSTNITIYCYQYAGHFSKTYDIDKKKPSAVKAETKTRINSLRNKIFDMVYTGNRLKRIKKLLEMISEKSASLRLTTLPIKEEGF